MSRDYYLIYCECVSLIADAWAASTSPRQPFISYVEWYAHVLARKA